MNNFSCSTVRSLSCHILRPIMFHTFSMGDRSGLQAGQSSSCTLLLQSHAVVTGAECVLVSLSCWNNQGRPWKRQSVLDGSRCCSKTCLYLSALMLPSQILGQLPMMPWALTHPHTITDAALELCAENNPDCPFPLWPRRNHVHDFQKEFSGVCVCCWCLTLSLHGRVWTVTCRCSDELC